MLSSAAKSIFCVSVIRSSLCLRNQIPKVTSNLAFKVNLTSSPILLNDTEKLKKEGEFIPWYLRESHSTPFDKSIFKAEFPKLPQNSPSSLEPIIKNMIDKLGFDNFKVFDLRDREEELPISSIADFMIICQGKSEKHLQNASQELLSFIKKEFGTYPYVEGLSKQNSTKKMKKRMKKRISSTKNQSYDKNFGLQVNSWIMIDSKIDNVFIHLLTPERRKFVNLEYMWCKPEEKIIYQQEVIETNEEQFIAENGREIFDNDSIFSGIFKRFYSTKSEVPIEQLALQQLKFNDIQNFEITAQKIRNDPKVAEKVLSIFINELKSQNMNQINQKFLSHYSKFFNRAFPLEPNTINWTQLFEFQTILHLLSPITTPFSIVRDTLKNQVSAGEPILIKQFEQYLDLLSQSPELNTLNQDKNEFNSNVYFKFSYLFDILKIFEVTNPLILKNDDIFLKILRIPTFQHLYNKVTPNQTLLLHKNFRNLLNITLDGQDRNFSDAIIEFVLTTYAKSNDVNSFYSFWESIHKLKQNGNELIVDDRPWCVLFDLLLQDYRDNLVEKLVNVQLPRFISLHPSPIPEIKSKVTTLLNKFDESGKAYKNLRDHFS